MPQFYPLASLRARSLACGVALAFALIAAGHACAEVSDAAANGFTVKQTAHIQATPDKVYDALIAPQRWWSSQHSFSGNSANMSLDAKAGGCWCETLANGGSVLLMTVVYASPGNGLRMRGALGPFQTMAVDGALIWSLKSADGGTDVTLISSIGGYDKDGFEKISHAADGVMGEQIERLKHFVETGAPETAMETKP